MRRLQQILTDESALAELLKRRQRELGLEERVKRTLPPALAAHVAVADGRATELVLAVASGAAAALLRQRVPDLLEALLHEGWEFTGIRVRVQARPAPQRLTNTLPKQLDAASAATLRRLATMLGDTQLAAALQRLARHAAAPGSHRAGEALDRVEDQDRQQ